MSYCKGYNGAMETQMDGYWDAIGIQGAGLRGYIVRNTRVIHDSIYNLGQCRYNNGLNCFKTQSYCSYCTYLESLGKKTQAIIWTEVGLFTT